MSLEWQSGSSVQIDRGAAVQKTTNGLLMWRPDDNSTWFFNSDRTYILTAEYGLRIATIPTSSSAPTATPELIRTVPIPASGVQTEVSLFDQRGRAVAYIALDDEATIYTWSGKPVAYLSRDGNDVHIYNFSGRHLGWFEDGLFVDHGGNVAGFRKGALNVATELEPFKGFREFKPFKGFQEFAPFKPLRSGRWSSIPLDVYLAIP
jgi:hypothetical protein